MPKGLEEGEMEVIDVVLFLAKKKLRIF